MAKGETINPGYKYFSWYRYCDVQVIDMTQGESEIYLLRIHKEYYKGGRHGGTGC